MTGARPAGWRAVAIWASLALAPALVYYRVYLAPAAWGAHFWGDTNDEYWPDLTFFYRSIAHGQLPLWNPDERGGFPFALDPQPGVLYPPNWLLVAVALLLGRVPYWLLQFKILMHLSLAATGWYAWLLRRFSWPAAVVGALGACFGCYSLENVQFGLVWPIAWVPWCLYALDRWLRSARVGAALGMAASLGAMATAGSPPAALYGFMVLVGLGLPLLWRRFLRSEARVRWQLLRTGMVAGGTAALLSLPTLLGAAQLTSQSVLQKRAFSYVDAGRLEPHDFLAFLLPATSDRIVYLGVSLVVLALVGLCRRPARRICLASSALVAVGMLLALGDNTPVLGWAAMAFPPVWLFRLPPRYLYLTQIGLAVLASVGADELVGARKRGSRARLLVTWLTLGGLALGSFLRFYGAAPERSVDRDVWMAALLLGLVWLAAHLGRSRSVRKWWSSGALACVVLLDMGVSVRYAHALRNGVFVLPARVSPAALNDILRQTPEYRVWDEFGLGFRAGARLGVRDLRGYMDPLRLANYERMATRLMQAPDLLRRWGVRWVLTGVHPYVGVTHNRVDVGRLGSAVRLEPHVFELPSPRPAGYFTARAESPTSDSELWETLEADPMGASLQLPPGMESDSEGGGADSPAQLLHRSNNALSFVVAAPSKGWFVVNEAYFPGWVATVDGQPQPIYRVDGWIRGIPVAPGTHRVELRFRPTAWLVVASLGTLTWLGLAAAWLWSFRRVRW